MQSRIKTLSARATAAALVCALAMLFGCPTRAHVHGLYLHPRFRSCARAAREAVAYGRAQRNRCRLDTLFSLAPVLLVSCLSSNSRF
jgi:hypothetical protein